MEKYHLHAGIVQQSIWEEQAHFPNCLYCRVLPVSVLGTTNQVFDMGQKTSPIHLYMNDLGGKGHQQLIWQYQWA